MKDSQKTPSGQTLRQLSLAALGIVFGDIGTSPLYAIRECFHGEYGIAVTDNNILGVLSLMFWVLILIVSFKYLTFILRADNNGEGGVIALTALIRGVKAKRAGNGRWGLVGLGLFAACLLYGDGMITPAISVLSAVEGIQIITPIFSPYVIPVTVIILVSLFTVQHRGTARVGRLFGPIILIWLLVLALLGMIQIYHNPQILRAIFPWYGLRFLAVNRLHGFIVLGAVFLVVTGAEALYADMGHFGKRPIRLTWFILVLPALVANYFGQGALLLVNPGIANHPFYAMVPSWAMIPMVVLATIATIIASQAVITGSFSLTRQAIQLGYLPRLRVTQTSATRIGQIYVAPVNWLLMICTVGLVVGFQSSSKLAAAYGVAVTSTMVITTSLFFFVARWRWGWSRITAGGLAAVFLLVDIPFFTANITKIVHGAWFPIVIGALFFVMMVTWKQGRAMLADQVSRLKLTGPELDQRLAAEAPHKIRGQAVFLSGNPAVVPESFLQNLRHNRVLHSTVAFLHVKTESIPRVPYHEKIVVEKIKGGFYQIIAHYGYMEEPTIQVILDLVREQGLDLKIEELSFYLGREKLTLGPKPKMGRLRSGLYVMMARNSVGLASFYDIPRDHIIEVGIQLQL